MARLQACLIDAYGTILHTDFTAHRIERAAMAGVSADVMDAEFRRPAPALAIGQLSMTEASVRIHPPRCHIAAVGQAVPRPDRGTWGAGEKPEAGKANPLRH